MPSEIRIGTAAWAISRDAVPFFPGPGSHLERYARVLDAVEINSTFYKLPRAATLERWRDTTPEHFRFSMKVPGSMTHEAGLRGCSAELVDFVRLAHHLGPKLGPLLVQLPPSLEFDARAAQRFLKCLRSVHAGAVVWEPRHASWFDERVTALLDAHGVARVAADPPRHPGADRPAAFGGVEYHRLHGSPRMYYSRYTSDYLDDLAQRLTANGAARSVWCIFDNTALGAALPNALELRERVADSATRERACRGAAPRPRASPGSGRRARSRC